MYIYDPPLAPFVQMGTLTSAATPFEFDLNRPFQKAQGVDEKKWPKCFGLGSLQGG